MLQLREVISEFKARHGALGHFNVSDSNQLKAVARASAETKLPVVVGLSEGEREYFPLTHARALIDAYKKEGVSLYLNADHTYSIEKARAAIDAGVDSIVVDGAQLPFAENAKLLESVVAIARASGRDVLVEGELGYIGTSSNVMETLPDGIAITEGSMTKPEELRQLVEVSGIDLAAPAVGNIHGIVKRGQPRLSITRIMALAQTAGVPLVLHGGSGSSDAEFTAAVKAGVAMIHINTELRVLYRDALTRGVAEYQQEAAPYKFLTPVVEEMAAYVVQKVRLFAGIN